MFGWIWLDPLLFALEIREGSILVFRKSPYKICNLGHFSIAIFEKQDINRFRRNSDVRSFQRADFIFFQTYLASLRPLQTRTTAYIASPLASFHRLYSSIAFLFSYVIFCRNISSHTIAQSLHSLHS